MVRHNNKIIRNMNIIIIVQHIPKAKDTRFLQVKY